MLLIHIPVFMPFMTVFKRIWAVYKLGAKRIPITFEGPKHIDNTTAVENIRREPSIATDYYMSLLQ